MSSISHKGFSTALGVVLVLASIIFVAYFMLRSRIQSLPIDQKIKDDILNAGFDSSKYRSIINNARQEAEDSERKERKRTRHR